MIKNEKNYFESISDSNQTDDFYKPCPELILAIFMTLGQEKGENQLINSYINMESVKGISVVMSMLACILALGGFEPTIIYFNEECFKKKNYPNFYEIYENLNIKDKINYQSFKQYCNNYYSESKRSNKDLSLIENKGAINLFDQTLDVNKKKVLLVFNIETLFTNEFKLERFNFSVKLQNEAIKNIIKFIYENRFSIKDIIKKFENNDITTKPEVDIESLEETYNNYINLYMKICNTLMGERIKEICNILNKIYNPLNEICNPLNEICNLPKEICNPPKEICDPLKEEWISIVKDCLKSINSELMEAGHKFEYGDAHNFSHYKMFQNMENPKIKDDDDMNCFHIRCSSVESISILREMKIIGISSLFNMGEEIPTLKQDLGIKKFSYLGQAFEKSLEQPCKVALEQNFFDEISNEIDRVQTRGPSRFSHIILVCFENSKILNNFYNKNYGNIDKYLLQNTTPLENFIDQLSREEKVGLLVKPSSPFKINTINTGNYFDKLGLHIIQTYFGITNEDEKFFKYLAAVSGDNGSHAVVISSKNLEEIGIKYNTNRQLFLNKEKKQLKLIGENSKIGIIDTTPKIAKDSILSLENIKALKSYFNSLIKSSATDLKIAFYVCGKIEKFDNSFISDFEAERERKCKNYMSTIYKDIIMNKFIYLDGSHSWNNGLYETCNTTKGQKNEQIYKIITPIYKPYNNAETFINYIKWLSSKAKN